MAEQKGFFRRIFSFGSDREEDRVPESGDLPRPSDTELGRPEAPDPDVRPKAAASSIADAETGASPEDGGGIIPLAGAETGPEDSSETGAAQKKTPKSS